jgi:lysyl-tRNA synthetase class 2
MTTLAKRPLIRRRQRLQTVVRDVLEAMGYDEVETPLLVRTPGMEPAIQAFRTAFVPELGGLSPRPLWLHTSPEFAMKRLLADGWERLFQITKVFRNGEVSPTHNPEFTMLEFYRAGIDCHALMDDVEALVRAAAKAMGVGPDVPVRGHAVDIGESFERLTVREAMLRETGLDVVALEDAGALRAAARARGYHVPESATTWDDVFFSVFVGAVEPKLGVGRPTFLHEYPARLAALARLKPSDPRVAERFELYAGGLELANGFSELVDADEQRRRFEAEQRERQEAGREVYPLDEPFLEAVARMPPAAGVAVGFDRLAMWLLGAESIDELLLFPACDEWRLGRGL